MSRGRLILLAAAALLLLGGAAVWQRLAAERDGSAPLERGTAALMKGDMRTARVELMNAIKVDPRSVAARMAQARVLVALGDGAGAQAELVRVRQLGGSIGKTRAPMAQALLLQGDADAALRELRAGDIPAEDAALAERVEGEASAAKGDMAAAAAAFDGALRLAPRDPATWIAAGRFRLAIGDQAGAIGAADGAVAIDPNNARALTLRGELTRDQYGLKAALPWFERALAASPDDMSALTAYAATLAELGEASRMLSVTRRILALDPGNARAWMMQAVMAARAGRDDLARALLDRTQGRLDGEPATMLLRGVLQLEEGNAVLAVEALAPLVAQQPENRAARALLGRAYLAGGDYGAAAAALAPLVAQRDADPYVLTLAARVQEQLGNRRMAQDMLARAAWPQRPATDIFASAQDAGLAAGAPPPSFATAWDNIPYIRAMLRSGRASEAVDRAALVARANPGAPAAQIVLGDALDAAGRFTEATEAYEQAANIRFGRDVALRLAAAWGKAGNPARGVQVMRLYLAQNPNDIVAQRLAAAVAMQAQDWRGALRLLKAIEAQIGGQDALLMTDLARASLETGDGAAARAYAAHAYRLLPMSPATADIFGWTLLRTGRGNQQAIDLLEKAAALAPGHPTLQLHLGQAYAAMGRRGEAKLALARAAAVPGFAEQRQAREALAAL